MTRWRGEMSNTVWIAECQFHLVVTFCYNTVESSPDDELFLQEKLKNRRIN